VSSLRLVTLLICACHPGTLICSRSFVFTNAPIQQVLGTVGAEVEVALTPESCILFFKLEALPPRLNIEKVWG
jgi:hypothetical protein